MGNNAQPTRSNSESRTTQSLDEVFDKSKILQA